MYFVDEGFNYNVIISKLIYSGGQTKTSQPELGNIITILTKAPGLCQALWKLSKVIKVNCTLGSF